ncbi:MAG: HK97 gp10 family phage protein, partial [Candidatus Izemoplasmatales bacterium]|nr:HK97 gp10 family phage protein [Candidatus Izemoplasmatales bacterium]
MVSLDELAVEISELVESYAEDVIKAMEKVLDETADKVLTYIQSKAPRSGKSYGFAESFVAIPEGQGINKRIAIYSSNKGRLTHLLEFGFTHRGGKFVGPRPFMRPAFD